MFASKTKGSSTSPDRLRVLRMDYDEHEGYYRVGDAACFKNGDAMKGNINAPHNTLFDVGQASSLSLESGPFRCGSAACRAVRLGLTVPDAVQSPPAATPPLGQSSYSSLPPLAFLVFVTVAIALLPSFAFAQDKAAKVDALMSQYHQKGQFNGSVLVAEKGSVILKKGYGMADMEWDIPNAPDTKFRLGSITKQFTSMLIMQLVQEGKIKLDGRLSDYLPYYRKDTGQKVTIHNLLTHTSGIPSYTSIPGFFKNISRDPYEVQEFVKKYCSGDLKFEPGSKFEYDNSGYFLLGAIIEQLTGVSYERALQQRIFDALGMKDSGYDHYDTVLKKRASGYQLGEFGAIRNAYYLDMSIPYAAGSLYSTVEDLFKWDRALYTDKLLSESNKEIMFKPFLSNYAYGWVVDKVALGNSQEKVPTISHGGGINGFNTLEMRLIGDRSLIVLLNNTGGAKLDEMARNIAGILYDKPYGPASPAPANH
jgi:CubicO group peptidase (beta-lactamase class C family)